MYNHSKNKSSLYAPISIGELFDKKSILEIKMNKISGGQLENISKELKLISEIIEENKIIIEKDLYNKLMNINLNLWEIEDKIRLKENSKEFDKAFIDLARSVYTENDKRAKIKRQINVKYNSNIVEEKFYSKYT
tara:strand:+ start:103 stop:507 length:405 start_codon:yes stop_codon:yes gene_type:complete